MVDTDRMRRVLERVRPGSPPMPPVPPPPPRPMPEPPPIPEPPPRERGPEEWMRRESELSEILRGITRKSPALRRRMESLLAASRRRQNTLRRYIRWDVPPPRQMRDGTVSMQLRRGERLTGELRDDYAREARKDPTFAALARSAGETEKSLSELSRRMR